MGSICSCLCMVDFEEYMHSDASIYRHCTFLRCLAQRLIHACTALIQREELRAVPLSVQVTASLDSATPITDNFVSGTHSSPPRPLPYDDLRCSQLQRDVLGSRRDKSSHFHEETELLRKSNNDTNTESMSTADKWSGFNMKVDCCSKSLLNSSMEVATGVKYSCSSAEDEDVCPTCLEEYTSENPRIIMKCSHHFHLGCIYEGKERSEFCPVCGKVMVLNETK